VTGQLADSTMEDLNGKIVFQQFLGSGSWIDHIKKVQSAGAIAILYGTVSGKLASLDDFGIYVSLKTHSYQLQQLNLVNMDAL
jgi:hypothetical protein